MLQFDLIIPLPLASTEIDLHQFLLLFLKNTCMFGKRIINCGAIYYN